MGTMHRFNHFVKTARDNIPALFATYENQGGEYHGADDPIFVTKKQKQNSHKKRKRKEPTSLRAAIQEEEEDEEFI